MFSTISRAVKAHAELLDDSGVLAAVLARKTNEATQRATLAAERMMRFARRTGLTFEASQRRYLWTDAYAVCNFLGLARATGDPEHHELALRLIDAVHRTLGQHRDDDTRSGWLSGLSDAQAREHPTLGGLRIGKPLAERGPLEPLDGALEWERDGQYFHYLTKWMHALDQATRATGHWTFNVWARELAVVAFEAFAYPHAAGGGERRMRWKMSVDLTRPLVDTMGQHDPLDGYVTYAQLQATVRHAPEPLRAPPVGQLADELATAIERGSLHSADPLGLGGLLFDAIRVEQLLRERAFGDETLVEVLLAAAGQGLALFESQDQLRWPAERRLPFRELGLALGLRGLELIADQAQSDRLRALLRPLQRYLRLADEIETFWQDEQHQRSPTWAAHIDINDVMLASVLLPEGFLMLGERPGSERAAP